MKKIENKIAIFYVIITIYTIISLVISTTSNTLFTFYLNPIFWFLIFCLGLKLTENDQFRFKGKIDKAQIVFINILIYLIIYFILGLFFGYQKSPYSHDVIGYIKNINAFVIIVIFKEFTRSILINRCADNKLLYVLTTLIFILLNINLLTFKMSLKSAINFFEYLCGELFPLIIENILLSYLVKMGGCNSSLAYTLPIAFSNVILPIFPNLNWFIKFLLKALLVLTVFLNVSYIDDKKTKRLSRRRLKKSSPITALPLLVIITLIVLFISGAFKYVPTAIMSNSMYKEIERGDVVIISKLSDKEKKSLKEGDIIQYKLDNAFIVHRIIKVENDKGKILYTTKGDNNNMPDEKKVAPNQVVGRIRYKISKIGYPSVLLNEFLKKQKPNVET